MAPSRRFEARGICGSRNTADEQPCKLSASGCPHASHRSPDRATSSRSDGADEARRAALRAQIDAGTPIIRARAASVSMPQATTGFASDTGAFLMAVNDVQNKIGLDADQIIHDYWLVRSLHGVADMFGNTGEMVRVRGKEKRVRVGRWAFGGGTSLTAAWGIGDRYSEDIDGNLFVEHDEISKSVQHKVCKSVLNAALEAFERSDHITHGDRVRTTRVSVDDLFDYLKFETSIQRATSDFVSGIVEPRGVVSILGQHATSANIEKFPELGGFELLCIRPAWTAVNKFDALHRRSASGDHEGVRGRGRDLYDLWAIAVSKHADDVRTQIPELWERAASAIRDAEPRPSGGYGSAELFTPGASANEALRAGYEDAVSDTVWGDAPPFAEAIEAARGLDQT